MDTINFLRHRLKKLSQQELKDKKWLNWSLYGLSGVILVTLISVGISFGLNYQYQRLNERHNSLKQTILSQENVEKSYVIFYQKLKTLSLLLQKRANKQAGMNLMSTLLGPEVSIREINYKEDESILSFGLKAPSLNLLSAVFDRLQTPEVRQVFKTVSKSDLKRLSDGSYTIMINVTL